MRIGVLGTGGVGRALGKGFVTLGHDVKMGSRSPTNEKAVAWAKEIGSKASVGTFGQAATFGEVIVLATLGVANDAVLRDAGPDTFRGKVVIDATNPLDLSGGVPPTLAVSGNDSGGERVQRLLPDAHVVKAFNTVGNAFMFRPSFPGGPPDMFICGNDQDAKVRVGRIVTEFGWGVVDAGGIESSRYLEAMCMVWVLSGIHSKNWNQAFKMLKK
jgi:predicted dinucleotide-binding enzyme